MMYNNTTARHPRRGDARRTSRPRRRGRRCGSSSSGRSTASPRPSAGTASQHRNKDEQSQQKTKEERAGCLESRVAWLRFAVPLPNFGHRRQQRVRCHRGKCTGNASRLAGACPENKQIGQADTLASDAEQSEGPGAHDEVESRRKTTAPRSTTSRGAVTTLAETNGPRGACLEGRHPLTAKTEFRLQEARAALAARASHRRRHATYLRRLARRLQKTHRHALRPARRAARSWESHQPRCPPVAATATTKLGFAASVSASKTPAFTLYWAMGSSAAFIINRGTPISLIGRRTRPRSTRRRSGSRSRAP